MCNRTIRMQWLQRLRLTDIFCLLSPVIINNHTFRSLIGSVFIDMGNGRGEQNFTRNKQVKETAKAIAEKLRSSKTGTYTVPVTVTLPAGFSCPQDLGMTVHVVSSKEE